MKTLIAYYSRTGTTKKVAEFLKSEIKGECDVEEILTVKNRAGVLGYLACGSEASRKVPAEIKEAVKDPRDYDLVIIGTPVWAWNISSPIRAYLMANKDKFKKIAVFCTAGGDGAGKALSEMEYISKITPDAKLGLLTKDVQSGNFIEKAAGFVKSLGF